MVTDPAGAGGMFVTNRPTAFGVEDALSPTLPRAGRGRCVGPRSGQPVHAHRDKSPCCTQARRLPPRRQTARSRAGWSCTLPPPLAVEKGGFAATQPARPSGCAACGGRRALPFRAAKDGESVSGKFTGTVQLTSGKFAIVEKSHEFTLVPWRPIIDRQLGREVAGIMQGGSVSWQLGRQRGLGL